MRVLIVEDSALLREGLVRLLDDAGHATTALADAEGVAAAASDADLVILDVRLPPTWTDEGIRAALAVRAALPDLPILVLSQYVEERYAADLIAARGGALGYLLKDRVADVADFLDTVRRIGAGATVLDPEVVAQLLARRTRDDRLSRLTSRERAVLALIAEGRSNAAIARTLHVSEGSVEKHVTAVFRGLGLEQDDSGNRRVLAALVHLDQAGLPGSATPTTRDATAPTTRDSARPTTGAPS